MEAAYPKEDLRQRIRWYVNLRWFIVLTVGLLGSLPQYFQQGLVSQVRQNFLIIGGVLAVNLLFLIISSFRALPYGVYRALAVSQLGLDIAITTAVVFFNGGIENIVAMLYVIPIVMSGAMLGRLSIYATGLTAAVLYDFLIGLDYLNKIHPENVLAPQLHGNTNYVVQTLFLAPAMLLTITVITDFVARLLRERSELAAKLNVVSEAHAQIEAVIQSMGSALVAVNRKGRIELVNESFEKLTGWRRDEVVGADINDILPLLNENGQPVEAASRPLLKLLARRSRRQGPGIEHLSQFYYARKDGSIFPFISAATPIALNGKVIGATTVFEDATETKKIEQLKNNFVAMASHQLKTPIGEIQGYAQNMLGGVAGKVNKRQLEYLNAIVAITTRCAKLLSDLLDISVIERGNLLLDRQPVELATVIDQAVTICHERLEQKKLRLKINQPDDGLVVRADANKLVEALVNVLANAISYTKPRSTITIETKRQPRFALILVTDQGRGMSPKLIDSIFKKDSVLGAPQAEGGTGIGLYLATQLMGLQKGDISVLSSTSKGTTVALKIPLEGEL